jgi:hypothetical protein
MILLAAPATSAAPVYWQPIVVDKAGVIICGHTRLLAAQRLNLTEVRVHVAANLTAAQVRAYRLMDNRSHQESDWDLERHFVDGLGAELATSASKNDPHGYQEGSTLFTSATLTGEHCER